MALQQSERQTSLDVDGSCWPVVPESDSDGMISPPSDCGGRGSGAAAHSVGSCKVEWQGYATHCPLHVDMLF